MSEQIDQASETIPLQGNCFTAFAGAYACRHVETLAGEIDGCSAVDPRAEEFVARGDLDRACCPCFECDPATLVRKALAWADRMEKHWTAAHRVVRVAKAALTESSDEAERAVRSAIENYETEVSRS